ncbi:unnamed protein product [Trichobilharzia regenti]|nr:unnamed protein product [Trichobilharzia regenti]
MNAVIIALDCCYYWSPFGHLRFTPGVVQHPNSTRSTPLRKTVKTVTPQKKTPLENAGAAKSENASSITDNLLNLKSHNV